MKSLISSTCLLALAFFSMPHYAQAESDTFVFTYDYEGAVHDLFGIQRKVQIDAAMLICDSSLVGTEIRGISVDIPTQRRMLMRSCGISVALKGTSCGGRIQCP